MIGMHPHGLADDLAHLGTAREKTDPRRVCTRQIQFAHRFDGDHARTRRSRTAERPEHHQTTIARNDEVATLAHADFKKLGHRRRQHILADQIAQTSADLRTRLSTSDGTRANGGNAACSNTVFQPNFEQALVELAVGLADQSMDRTMNSRRRRKQTLAEALPGAAIDKIRS